jgi:hypothetical protein
MNETSHVNEPVKETEIGKAEVSEKTGVDAIPDTIKELLRDPPLLPHESEARFLELLESFRSYAEPENVIEYHQSTMLPSANGRRFAIASWPQR